MTLLLLACAVDPAPPLPELDRPATEAVWSADEAAAALSAALLDGFPMPAPPRDAYLELLSHGDAVCPGHETYIDDTNLYGCEADSGYWFSGVSEYLLESHAVVGGEYAYWAVNGDMLFLDDAGEAFEGGGHVGGYWLEVDGARSGQFEIVGTWRWEGHDGWLAGDGASAVIFYTFDPDARSASLDGAVSWSGLSLYLDQLRLDASGAAEGDLEIRDPSGGWHAVTLDGGCGALRFEGGAGAPVCLDLSSVGAALMDWMDAEAPWSG